jgi:hypothetical protein
VSGTHACQGDALAVRERAGRTMMAQQLRGRTARRQRRRRRLGALLRFVVFLLFIFIAVWAGVRVAHAGTDASVYTGHEYVVKSGDTLWTIAGRQYGADADLRHAVYEIRQASQLQRSTVVPGQHLTLPYLGD